MFRICTRSVKIFVFNKLCLYLLRSTMASSPPHSFKIVLGNCYTREDLLVLETWRLFNQASIDPFESPGHSSNNM